MDMQVKEAIVLAGGLGTRLRSAVPDLPKCMAPVNGKPFLCYIIDYYSTQGIQKFIFSLGYKHELISAWIKEKYPSLAVEYVIEREPLGTGGAIQLAVEKVQAVVAWQTRQQSVQRHHPLFAEAARLAA